MAANDDKPISTVVVLFAMESEAEPFIEKMGLKRDNSLLPAPLPCHAYSGETNGITLHVVVNGKDPVHKVDSVGTVPAALAAYAALQALKPDVLVSAGTAGGFKARGGAVGDVYLASAFRHHDRAIQIPVFDAYGVYELPAPAAPALRAALGLKDGIVSTGNSLAATPADLATLQESGAAVKEMEAAAVAYVAALFGTPLLAVKAITDIVDGERATAEEFMENLGAAAAALQRTLPKVVEFIAKKRISEI